MPTWIRVLLEGGGGEGSGSGFIAGVIGTGLAFLNRLTLLGGQAAAGVATAIARQAISISQSPAFSVGLLATEGTLAEPVLGPAIAQTARISEYKVTDLPAAELVQVQYSLTRLVGGNAQAAVGTAWTSPSNAVGDHNGTVATVAGSLGGSTNGIELNYANVVGKGELAITGATLYFYAEVIGDATGLLSDTVVSYNIGGGLVQLEAIAGNFASLAAPRAYPLPLLDSWAEYDALAARVVQTMAAASVGVTARLDAIEIDIVASRTDAL